MANCGNFLEYAGSRCGIDVGYGKILLAYADQTEINISDLTADAINTAISNGTIKGVIKGWHTIAGAPVAEVSVDRVGTSEMKLIKPEVLADTLTFENTLSNNEVLGDLVKAGTIPMILIDDIGNVFAEKSNLVGKVKPMLINFSNKVTSAFQGDNATDKTVAITARYLVKEVDVIIADVETELINSKTLVGGYLGTVSSDTATSKVFKMFIKDKSTGKAFAGAILTGEVSAIPHQYTTTASAATYNSTTGELAITLTGTGYSLTGSKINVSISGIEAYMKEAVVNLGE